MTKENFIKCINAILELEKWCDDLYALGLDITNSKYFNYGVLADNLWLEAFGVEGLDWINWWLYERVVKPEDELKLGQTVNAKIIDINKEKLKIGLSIKEIEGTSAEYGYEEYIKG